MTPEEKAEKWLKDREVLVKYPYTVDSVRDALISESKQGYLAGYAEALNHICEKEQEQRNKNIVRRTDYERCLDKGDTLDYDIEPEHS